MDLHLQRLHEAVNLDERPANETLDHLATHFHGSDAQMHGAQADDGDGAIAGRGDELSPTYS